MQAGLGERLVDAGLLGAERATALQQERYSFERWALLDWAQLAGGNRSRHKSLSFSHHDIESTLSEFT